MEKHLEYLVQMVSLLSQPNWLEYLQTFASIISIIISAWAVVMAIKVPKKIAYKQDKISLFNERMIAYDILQKHVAFAGIIKKCQDCKDTKIYKRFFNVAFFGGNYEIIGSMKEIDELIIQSIPLKRMPFLFNDITQKEVDEITSLLSQFAFSLMAGLDFETTMQKYILSVENFCNMHNNHILEMLKME